MARRCTPCRFTPTAHRLASGGVDRSIRLWNVADGKEWHKLEGHPDDVYVVAYSHDGKRLASLGYGGSLFVWDAEAAKVLWHQKMGDGLVTYGLAWSPDGKRMAVAAADGKGYILQMP